MRRNLALLLLLAMTLAASAAHAADARADQLLITLAGDCTIGSEPQFQDVRSGFVMQIAERGFDWPFSGVIDRFTEDDLTLVNLEGVFTDYKRAEKKPFTFRATPKYADILTGSSIEAVNLANNHTKDFGARGLADTKQALDERSIAYAIDWEPTVIEVKGRKVALFGMAYPVFDQKVGKVCAQIAEYRVRADIDLIIISCHWGVEMKYDQDIDQKRAAARFVEAGADLVVGTHPHVLQGMQMYQGKPIFYSLGNFCFGGNSMPRDRDTAVIRLAYDISGERPKLAQLEAIPYLVSAQEIGIPQDYRPVPADGEAARRILKKLSCQAIGLPDGFFDTGRWELQ